jgi:hypothetical protein
MLIGVIAEELLASVKSPSGLISEAANATDSALSGFVFYSTLVDDPASVRETVDAYLGQIMREAASAAATQTAGLAYATSINEPAAASSTQNATAPTIWTAAVDEVLIAVSAQDAIGISAPPSLTVSASRAGLVSVIVTNTGKTQIISNVGAVT